ncbi:HNH endonuclease signature motif containing protein [Paraburkholderia atlantica]|uniref:HNH endonuclease signature motif containing protein n=1 Tax=Paraburkholderia atlantica TaxID=2654982 RepID=UPI0016155FED|nr:HNH endonuclease signature motif containing protein [Paraburkholderia atlantica]MBB5414133.1 hypothetical protein [Paraburkholderia atlantica]
MTAAAYSITLKNCSTHGCDRQAQTRGFCNKHYKQARNKGLISIAKPPSYGPICLADGCGDQSAKRGYCDKHYRRIQRNGTLDTVRQAPGLPQYRSDGYIDQLVDGRRQLQHIVIAEKAIGKPLPKGAEVHHINEIRSDNRNENLVVCPDRQYHMILHARQRALDACGHAGWHKCAYCGQYDDPTNMTGRSSRGKSINTFYHKHCAAKSVRERKAARKLKQQQ